MVAKKSRASELSAWALSSRVETWLLMALIVAITPLVHTVATWDADGALSPSAFALRHFSIPVLVCEFGIIWLAARAGFDVRYMGRVVSAPLRWLFAIWFSLALFAVFRSPDDVATSLFVTLRYTVHLITLFAIVFIIAGSKAFETAVWMRAITIGAMAYMTALVVFIALLPDPKAFSWAYRLPSATNVRQIGNHLSLLAIAPLALLLAPNASRRVLYFCALTSIVAFVAWTGTRGGLFGLVVGGLAGTIASAGFAPIRNMALAVASLASGLLLSLAIPAPTPIYGLFRMVSSVTSEDVSSGRMAMWSNTIQEIAKEPVFGFGAGRFRENMIRLYDLDYNHPHNLILQYVYDWGLIGGIAALVAVILLGITIIRTRDAGAIERFTAVSGLAAILAIAMIEGTLFHPLPILIGIALIAPTLGIGQRLQSRNQSQGRPQEICRP